MSAHLNLASCADFTFSPTYLEPWLFYGLLYLDYNRLLDSNILLAIYGYLIVQRFVLYGVFFKSLAYQICDHCEIPFLYVKQGYTYYSKTKKQE